MSLISSYAWPELECLLFFSVVLISVDVKNKVLDVLCIRFNARGDKFFRQIVGLYYLRKLTPQIIVKSSSSSSLLAKKGLVHVGIMGK